ncbi:MAG: thioredoxin family protein [Deltaproteobacteria bacterium]|nr:thioredoxin family protein [Deltaproteobacteria bacterium]
MTNPKQALTTRKNDIKRIIVVIFVLYTGFFLGGISLASSTKGDTESAGMLRVEAYASHESIHPGKSFQIAVIGHIKEGLHINSRQPSDSFLVPTVISFRETQGVTLGPVSYPSPKEKAFSFAKEKMSVYEGKVSFLASGQVSKNRSSGNLKLSGTISYQACSDKSCFMPESEDFEIALRVIDKGQPAKLVNQAIAIFKQDKSLLTQDELRAKGVIEKGIFYSLAAFFLFGLALNLTPCVYPVIPLTVSFFSTKGKQKKAETFLLAFCYIVGIAIVFSALGLISGLAGRQWGFLFQNPWFVIFISIIMLSMAASMFGAFEIAVPSFLMTRAGKARQGAIGSFVMGLTAGVIIAPCAAGIVIGLVGIIAKMGLVAKGAMLFFAMGMGLGLPYLFLALFSGLMNKLPQAGMWMVWVRKLFGIVLIGVALYFLIPQAERLHDQEGFYLGVLGVFGGLLLGFMGHNRDYTKAFKVFRAIAGCILIIAGAILVNSALHYQEAKIDWIAYKNESIEQLRKEKTPLLLDFYANWCSACRELDHKTFSNNDVAKTI